MNTYLTQSSHLINNHQPAHYGKMRFSSHRRKIFCHYCNNKSNLSYDGLITQWMCKKCDAVNYFDENGDITDPPIEIESPLPIAVRYAIPSSGASTALSTNSSIFCELCLKNQRLYTSSLAQYQVDVDIDDPYQSNIDFSCSKFQKDLEKRYPQVCEKCKPAALCRIKEAGKTAKADHLRRLMNKTRESQARKIKKSNLTLDNLGRILWNIGLSGQLVLNIITSGIISLHNFSTGMENSYLISMSSFTQSLITKMISQTWAFRVLICTLVSIWWCPKLKESNKSLKKTISDFKAWYCFQLFQAFLRVTFYNVMYNSFFSSKFTSTNTLWAHIVMAALTILINFKGSNFLRVDQQPLWDSKLEKIKLSPKLGASKNGSESIEDILDEIASTTNREKHSNSRGDLPITSTIAQGSHVLPLKYRDNDLRQSFSSDSSQPPSYVKTKSSLQNPGIQGLLNNNLSALNSNFKHDKNWNSSFRDNSILTLPARTTPSLHKMSEEEATRYLQTGELPCNQLYEEMDWQSTQSDYPAFHPRPKTPIKQLIHGPSLNTSPFWYKIPPAPITPAQRLRNPPNRPNLQVPSYENKQSIFHGINITRSNDLTLVNESKSPKKITKEKIELSQPKFFPPEPSSGSEIMLADLLTGITLSNSEDNDRGFSYADKVNQIIPHFAISALIPIIIFSLYSLFNVV